MIDMGLSRGAKALWKDDLLCDYTIKVEHQEFKVHKVVLASVSDYFHAMLTGCMKESQTDQVDLVGHSAKTVSDLIQLIYTGDDNIVSENATDILPCAVYLQIPAAIDVCKTRILNTLNEENCLHVLAMFLFYSFKDEAEKVKKFVQDNFKSAVDHFKPAELSMEIVQFVISIWEGTEWKLLTFIKEWNDAENRNQKKVNDLMSHVRFCLMTRQETAAVKEMDVYLESDGSWKTLVDKALEYHDLPVHMKVLNQSPQSTVRAEVSPFIITAEKHEGKKLLFSLDGQDRWRTHASALEGSADFTRFGQLTNVNNFLIVTSDDDRVQMKWHIFDPRTLIWTAMPGMCRQKAGFTLLHHDEHLYALGGHNMTREERQPSSSGDIECYSFRTNTWRVIGDMPAEVCSYNACIIGSDIYCCGKYSTRFDRFNLRTEEWESRAPLLSSRVHNSEAMMHVMRICNTEVIVLIDLELSTFDVYNPLTNQWSKGQGLKPLIKDIQLRWDVNNTSRTLLHGNTLYFLSVFSHEYYSRNNDDPDVLIDPINEKRYICMKWALPETDGKFTVERFGHIPVPVVWWLRHITTGMLAMPAHTFI